MCEEVERAVEIVHKELMAKFHAAIKSATETMRPYYWQRNGNFVTAEDAQRITRELEEQARRMVAESIARNALA